MHVTVSYRSWAMEDYAKAWHLVLTPNSGGQKSEMLHSGKHATLRKRENYDPFRRHPLVTTFHGYF